MSAPGLDLDFKYEQLKCAYAQLLSDTLHKKHLLLKLSTKTTRLATQTSKLKATLQRIIVTSHSPSESAANNQVSSAA